MLDHRQRLEKLRDQLETSLGSASENMLPQLAGSYLKVLDAIASLPGVPVATPKGVVTIDQAKQCRADRKSGAAPVSAAGAGVRDSG